MIPWFEIISLAGLGVLAWLWFDGVKAREEAVRVARQACLAEGYQFLDDTVAGVSLRPVRDDAGRLVLRRSYAFEYSDTGDNRRPGRVEMMGQVVEQLEIGPRLGTPRRVI